MKDLRVTILGGGSWGTTVASLVARNTQALLWARSADTVNEINEQSTNSRYLPDAKLSPKLRATHDFEEAVANADLLVMGVPAQQFRKTLEQVSHDIRPWVPVISLSKGLEAQTRLRMSELIGEILPGHPPGVLSGPNLAREIIEGQAAASVLAMEDETIVRSLTSVFSSGMFRVYTNTDIVGCELGGVLKNIIAIATGMGDGLGAGENTRAGMITRGLAELTRFGMALGGQAQTFAGLAGIGDLVATCTSPQSRNRHVGEEIGKGRSLEEIIDEMHMVAEGVKSTPAVMQLGEQHGVDMPITKQVHRVLYEEQTPWSAFRGLVRSKPGAEWEPG